MICPLFGFNGAKPSTIGFHSYERHDHAYTTRANGTKPSTIGFHSYERHMIMPTPHAPTVQNIPT